jgi:hypothetical protein
MLNDINDLSDEGSHFNIVYHERKWILSDWNKYTKIPFEYNLPKPFTDPSFKAMQFSIVLYFQREHAFNFN